MEAIIKNNKGLELLFWTALISSWLTFIFIFTLPFGFLYWLIVLVILFINRVKLKWYLLSFSAWTIIPLFGFVSGVKDYYNGQGTLKYFGLPSAEFYNLDKEYRTYNASSGCIILGFETLIQKPNNWAVQLCTKMFGFQKGVYEGFYPDQVYAGNLVDSVGEEANFKKRDNLISFNFRDKNYQISDEEYRDVQNIDSCNTAKVVVVNNELIIFKPIISGEEQVTYLAAMNNGNVFARYFEYAKEN